jgi:hypothetical protein
LSEFILVYLSTNIGSLLDMTVSNKEPVETGPEINISLGERNGATEVGVDVLPVPGQRYIIETLQVVDELASNGLGRWYKQADTVINRDPETDEECIRILFPQTIHFGAFRNAYGENAGRVLAEILESDGMTVNFDEKVKDLTPPPEGTE